MDDPASSPSAASPSPGERARQAGDAARVGLTATRAPACAPYPDLGSLTVGGSSGSDSAPTLAKPLGLQVPGLVFNVHVEELFDALFRSFEPGSFQDANWAQSHGVCANRPVAWEPAPERHAASAVVGGGEPCEGRGPPYIRLEMHRPVIAPQWVRCIVDLPESCSAVEEWRLYGLGQDDSFIVQMKDTIDGLPYSDCFNVWRRFKATSVGESRTQLDAEFQLQWSKACMMKGRVESGTLESLASDFSEKILPLAKRFLTARYSDTAEKPEEDSPDEGSLQLSPQEWVLAVGSLDCSALPVTGFERRAEGEDPLAESAARYELQFEIKDVHLVEDAERVDSADFRFDGIWMATAGLADALFLELCFAGGRELRTKVVAGRRVGGQLRASFAGDLLLFGDSEGERNLVVRICTWQQLQAAMNGNQHPVLGEAVLALDKQVCDLEPRCVVLPVWLSDEKVGLVTLEYEALLLLGSCVVSEGAACAAASARRPAKLRVEVLGVLAMPVPELSIHEFLSSVTSDDMLPPEKVFVELELGARCVETSCVEFPSGAQSAPFDQESALFVYGGEDALEVRVRSWRWPKELVSEVFIGSGSLPLECCRDTCELQRVDLPVSRAGIVTGVVSLCCQLFV